MIDLDLHNATEQAYKKGYEDGLRDATKSTSEPLITIYAARDVATGKLVSNITRPGHRFWMRKKDCEAAIRNHLQNIYRRYNNLELVELEAYEKVHTDA